MARPFSLLSLTVINIATFAPFAAAGPPAPFEMTWSSSSFGPDGPWQAVQVGVGKPAQTVALFPGGTFRSHLLTSQICSNKTLSPGVCYASAAGTYDPDNSVTALNKIIQFPAFTDFSHGGLQVSGTAGIGALDQIDLGAGAGVDGVLVPNVTLALHNNVAATYPGGSTFALEVGTLALGFLGTVNQSFGGVGPLINGSLIPGYMQEQNITSSNAFGLHIGSVNPKVPGSLYIGGYDQSRVCGDISTQQGQIFSLEDQGVTRGYIDMLDIKLNVMEGSSPWNATTVDRLLGHGNSSIGSALSVNMLPEAPYLDLPKSTCDAISAWLPVTYRADLGLYTWNTNDPQYQKIVSSASVLSFVFRKDQTNTQNITINVPFTLLNLTLEPPLTTTSTPYFPCNAQSYGRYSLGRAFLQAAFIGANWNVNGAQGVWWLAQAPGPNIGSQGNAKAIQDQDSTITPSGNNWNTSWEGAWTPLTGGATTVVASTSTPTAQTSSASSSNSGLPTGAKAGIGVGISVCAVAGLGLGAWLLLRHRRRRAKNAAETTSSESPVGPSEFPNSEVQRHWAEKRVYSGQAIIELPGQQVVHEMPGEHGR
jgi:hypothetical protein